MQGKVYYRMSKLKEAFTEAGLFSGNNSIYFTIKINRLEKKGRLKVMRNPATGHRFFTEDQIAEIVKAFSPGGSGCWYYKKPKPTKLEKRILKVESSEGVPAIADMEIEDEHK